MKIGIIGGAEIAHRMFIPALLENKDLMCMGIASNNGEKRRKFEKDFNIDTYSDYNEIIENPQVEAVYVPLPPALHYKWAKKALENNKHVFLEKPATISLEHTQELVTIAKERGLVIQENYMFQYHSQLKAIQEIINRGELGDIRLIKSSFGFPLREKNDFRYNKELGGGALLDAGGYVIKLGSILLGDTAIIKTASGNRLENFEVDMFGSITMKNEKGLVYQGSYGLDCYYQCSVELWGSKGRLYTNRIFTAPPNLEPIVTIEVNGERQEIKLPSDKHFSNSIKIFYKATQDSDIRNKMYEDLLMQATLVDTVMKMIQEV